MLAKLMCPLLAAELRLMVQNVPTHHAMFLFFMVLAALTCDPSKYIVTASLSDKDYNLLKNTSNLLDFLLSEENYDRQIRPGFGGPPTVILTDIEIRSFGPVSETDMVYSIDCYFRQTWWDKRLSFSHGELQTLAMDWKFLQRVWIPDTYFLNGRNSYMHRVTVPNKFIRVRHDGRLRYSMRLTIKASCPMHLRKYPLDIQACPLEIGSFAYTARDVVYKWNGSHPVVMSRDVVLSQYEILNITVSNLTSIMKTGDARSTLATRFILRRRRGYFILQIYAPCAMIVGASWVSFWINRNDAAGRVAVGATTVLTLVTMGFGGRALMPRVNYATALDWFVILCFTFVFTAMVEYACVNYVDRYEAIKVRSELEKMAAMQDMQQNNADGKDKEAECQIADIEDMRLNMDVQQQQQQEDGACSPSPRKGCLRRLLRRRKKMTYRELAMLCGENGVIPLQYGLAGKLDFYARYSFPFTFAVLNIFYWYFYLYHIDDEIKVDFPEEQQT